MWFIKRYIGLDKSIFQSHPGRFRFIDKDVEISPDVHVISKIDFPYPKPKGNKYLQVKRGFTWQQDDFSHELVLVIKENDGLVILSGCSHNGILNIIDTVNKKFGRISIKAVLGGFHLIGLPVFNTMAGRRSDIEDLGRKMITYPVERFYSGHCTGQKAYPVLKNILGEKLKQLHTGIVIET